MPFHFCHEEMAALIAFVPGATIAWAWLRARFTPTAPPKSEEVECPRSS